jgi:hypothetical protein
MSADDITNIQQCAWNREALTTGFGALYTVEKTYPQLSRGDWVVSYEGRNKFWQIEKINNESILAWEVLYHSESRESYIMSGATKGNKRTSVLSAPMKDLVPFKIPKVEHVYMKGPPITYTVLVWDRTTNRPVPY